MSGEIHETPINDEPVEEAEVPVEEPEKVTE